MWINVTYHISIYLHVYIHTFFFLLVSLKRQINVYSKIHDMIFSFSELGRLFPWSFKAHEIEAMKFPPLGEHFRTWKISIHFMSTYLVRSLRTNSIVWCKKNENQYCNLSSTFELVKLSEKFLIFMVSNRIRCYI